MASLTDHLSDLVEDADAVLLFSPTSSFFNRFEDGDTEIIVVAPDNDVDAEVFVELPLPFDNVKDRIRFGIGGDGRRARL